MSIDTDLQHEELVADALNAAVGGLGVEILDHRSSKLFDDLSNINENKVIVRAYLPADAVASFSVDLSGIDGALVHTPVPVSDNWKTEWKRFFKAQRIGRRLVVRPPWEQVEDPRASDVDIVIDPGMAFGTGMHETTRLCLSALEKIDNFSTRILDVGCGSGVLSIAVAKLGAEFIAAIDVDEAAVTATRENAEANRVHRKIEASSTLIQDIDETYDTVIANILSSVLVAISSNLYDRTRTGGTLLLSGILTEEAEYVSEHFESVGLTLQETIIENAWSCLVMRKLP